MDPALSTVTTASYRIQLLDSEQFDATVGRNFFHGCVFTSHLLFICYLLVCYLLFMFVIHLFAICYSFVCYSLFICYILSNLMQLNDAFLSMSVYSPLATRWTRMNSFYASL